MFVGTTTHAPSRWASHTSTDTTSTSPTVPNNNNHTQHERPRGTRRRRTTTKIQNVSTNNRRHRFEVGTRNETLSFPYALAVPTPSSTNPVVTVAPDPELGNEAFTYVLESGDEGSVHIDSVREFNEDPEYLAGLTLYKLSVDAQKLLDESGLSVRQVAATLNTSPAQVYRLLDPANNQKTIRQVVGLSSVLGYELDISTRPRQTPSTTTRRATT